MNSKNITEAVVQSLRNAIEIQKYLDLHTSDPLPTQVTECMKDFEYKSIDNVIGSKSINPTPEGINEAPKLDEKAQTPEQVWGPRRPKPLIKL